MTHPFAYLQDAKYNAAYPSVARDANFDRLVLEVSEGKLYMAFLASVFNYSYHILWKHY